MRPLSRLLLFGLGQLAHVALGDEGTCSGFATPCGNVYTTTTCTDSSIQICPTFLETCEVTCERAGATGYNSPCRCRIQSLGCETVGFTSFCDSRISCEGFADCSALTNSLDCQLTDGCDWNPAPTTPTDPAPAPSPVQEPTSTTNVDGEGASPSEGTNEVSNEGDAPSEGDDGDGGDGTTNSGNSTSGHVVQFGLFLLLATTALI